MIKYIHKLTSGLNSVLDERFVSLILYGSRAGVCVDETSRADYNLIAIVENLTGEDLKNVSKIVRNWQKSKNPPPVFIDRQEWLNSMDVYAIEVADIKERYRLLYGQNIIDEIVISKEDIRYQCEREIKNLLIRVRQFYLVNCDRPKEIKRFLVPFSKNTVAIFRAIHRLLDIDVPCENIESVPDIAQNVGIDRGVFEKIILFKEGKIKIKDSETDEIMQELIDNYDKLLKFVDKI